MKRFVSAVLCIIIVLSTFMSISAFAEDSLIEIGEVYTSADGLYEYMAARYKTYGECCVEEYYSTTSSVQILKYVGKKPLPTNYTVPKKIDGFDVGMIGDKAFMGAKFKSVDFSNVRSVGAKAFANCKNLKSLNLESVSYIDKKAFAGCSSLSTVKFVNDYDVEIREKAFYNCPSLKKADIRECDLICGKALGYYYNPKTKSDSLVKGFTLNMKGSYSHALSNATSYIANNGINTVIKLDKSRFTKDNVSNENYDVGTMAYLRIDGKKPVSQYSDDTSIVRFDKSGKMLCLQGGKVNLKLRMADGKKYTIKLRSGDYFGYSYRPKLRYKTKYWNDLRDYTYSKGKKVPFYITVKKGKSVQIRIIGKVADIDNSYKSTSVAKFEGEKSDKIIKIIGLKKGETTLKLRINGVVTKKLYIRVR